MSLFLQNRPSLGQKPFICVSLKDTNLVELGHTMAKVMTQMPDAIEWRIDFLHPLDIQTVIAGIDLIRAHSEFLPLIVNCRPESEGGNPHGLEPLQVFEIIAAVCMNGRASYVDYPLSHPDNEIEILHRLSQHHKMGLILSHHDYIETPSIAIMRELLVKAYELRANVVKLAVMSYFSHDVMSVLQVTSEIHQIIPIPIISYALSDCGAFSRLVGGYYGSCLTYAHLEGSQPEDGSLSLAQMRATLNQLYPHFPAASA